MTSVKECLYIDGDRKEEEIKYDRCNDRCSPNKGLHFLGDRYITEEEVRECSGCGARGRPHSGYASPCPASTSGGHYFDKKTAEINTK